MHNIFLSYRRDDTAGHAGRLFDGLESHFPGSKIFMDVDSIAPGDDFVNRIDDAIASCDVALVLIGDDWLDIRGPDGTRRIDDPLDFVRVEVTAALKGEVTVIPVLVEGARMPNPAELPEDMRRLTRHNAIGLSDERWRYDTGRLIERVREIVGAAETPDRTRRRLPAVPRSPRLLAGAGAGLVAVVVVVALLAGRGGEQQQASSARLFGNSPTNPAGTFAGDAIAIGRGANTDIAVGLGAVWVVNRQEGTVSRVDPRSGAVVGDPIGAGKTLHNVAVGLGAVWATSEDERAVVRIDPASRSVSGAVPVDGFPEDVAAGAGAVWAVTEKGLVRIDPQTMRRVATIPTGAAAEVAVGDFSEVAVTAEARLIQIDPETNEAGTPVRIGETADGLAFDDAGSVWVAGPSAGTVTAVPSGGGGEKFVANVGGEPHVVSFGAGSIWVLDEERHQVIRLDPDNGEVLGQPIKVGENATSIAADEGGIWVGYGDGTLRRIEP